MTHPVEMQASKPHNGKVLDEVETKLRTWSAVAPDGAMVSLHITCTPTVARDTARKLRRLRTLADADVDHRIEIAADRMKRAKIDRWELSILRPLWLALAVSLTVSAIAEQLGLLP